MRKIAVSLAMATGLGACQTAQAPAQPELQRIVAEPTNTQTLIQSPDPNKWMSRTNQRTTIFLCRPLACPKKSSVRVITSPAPTRSIDEAALREYAKTIVPASVKASGLMMEANSSSYEHIIMKSSTTTKLRGFPAVVVEVSLTGRGEPKVGYRSYLFAGNTLIDTYSISTSREVALANMHSFIEAFGIADGPVR